MWSCGQRFQIEDLASVTEETQPRWSMVRIPEIEDPEDSIRTSGRDQVRPQGFQETNTADASSVPRLHPEGLTGLDVPNPDQLIRSTAHRDPIHRFLESGQGGIQTRHARIVLSQDSRGSALQIPDDQASIRAPGDHDPFVRSHSPDQSLVTFQVGSVCTCLRVPDLQGGIPARSDDMAEAQDSGRDPVLVPP